MTTEKEPNFFAKTGSDVLPERISALAATLVSRKQSLGNDKAASLLDYYIRTGSIDEKYRNRLMELIKIS